MKIDPYYQRRKYSAETLVCEDIKVMPIFVGIDVTRGLRCLATAIAYIYIRLMPIFVGVRC